MQFDGFIVLPRRDRLVCVRVSDINEATHY